MKKILAMLLLVSMIFALAACGEAKPAEPKAEEPAPAAEEPAAEEPAAEEPAAEEPAAEEPAAAAAYKLGLGVDVDTDESKTGLAQVDACAAAVILDAEGKIVAVKIDVAQSKMDVTDGQVDPEAEFLTKLEKGDAYGMKAYGNATYEWYEQAAAFEQYCIGKTGEEIAAMETREDGGHVLTTDEELFATCSISIDQFQSAVVKACADEQGFSFTAEGEIKLGLGIITKSNDSKPATAEEEGTVKMYSEFGAVVLDKDGRILAALTDAIQPQIPIDAAGEIGDIKFEDTKRVLKEKYGMSNIGAVEWYLQAANFEQYCIGKTAEELRATETVEDGDHVLFADEELRATCSISIEGMVNVVAKAADNAA